jgi:hypothetical protein
MVGLRPSRSTTFLVYTLKLAQGFLAKWNKAKKKKSNGDDGAGGGGRGGGGGGGSSVHRTMKGEGVRGAAGGQAVAAVDGGESALPGQGRMAVGR